MFRGDRTLGLVRGGLRGGMHAVLWNFVDASQRLLLMEAVKLIEWSGAFADLVRLLDGFRDISLGENHGFA